MDDTRPQINLYIETTVKGPKAREGAYLYILEYLDDQGMPHTQCARCVQKESENRMVLGALIRAVERINEPARIRVFTRCGYILNALRNDWPGQWAGAGWMNAKKQPVKNAEMWKRLFARMNRHTIEATDADHSYRDWMIFELMQKMEEEQKNAG